MTDYERTIEECTLEPFTITIKSGEKRYLMQVEQYYLSNQKENFKVRGGTKEMLITSNRPLLVFNESKKGIQWKLLSDAATVYKNPQAFEDILRALESHIKDVAYIRSQKPKGDSKLEG